MYKTPLTNKQKASNYSDSACISVIKSLMRKRGELRKPNVSFADMIGVSDATWRNWQNYAKPEGKSRSKMKKPNFNMVLRAAQMANVKVDLEAVS